MNTNQKGNIALGKAISYFTEKEYNVSIPLNDSQCYDLIIEKDGILKTVQVKYTSEKRDSGVFVLTLVTTSGTSRLKLYNIKDTFVDYLFVVTEENTKYLIPVDKITNNKSISLFKEKDGGRYKANLDTFNYLITG